MPMNTAVCITWDSTPAHDCFHRKRNQLIKNDLRTHVKSGHKKTQEMTFSFQPVDGRVTLQCGCTLLVRTVTLTTD